MKRSRPYQDEFVANITDHHWNRTPPARLLAVSPVGSGKTFMMGNTLMRLRHKNALVLAHTDELIEQLVTSLSETNAGRSIGIEKADLYANADDEIVVASVQTLGPKSQNDRLCRFPQDRFGIVVIDEAHHAVAPTYINILRHFKPDLLLGITATPRRADKVQLSNVFDDIVFERTLFDLIEEGDKDAEFGPYLSHARSVRVSTDVDLDSVTAVAGEFNLQELANAINVDVRNSLIVSSIEKYADDRKSILVFVTNIAHTEQFAQLLQQRGHSADFVHGKMPKDDRRKRLIKFKDGLTRIMVNCQLLREGYDNPRIDTVVMARPIISPTLYEQVIGRGLRTFPGKTDCLIIDLHDNCSKYTPMTISKAFGIRELDYLGSDIIEAQKAMKKADELGIPENETDTVDSLLRKISTLEKVVSGVMPINTKAEIVDLMSIIEPDHRPVKKGSIFAFTKINDSLFVMSFVDKPPMIVRGNPLGQWRITGNNLDVVAPITSNEPPWKVIDEWVKSYAPDSWRINRKAAKWRDRKPTPKQIALLKKKYNIMNAEHLTRGTVCGLMEKVNYLKWVKRGKDV